MHVVSMRNSSRQASFTQDAILRQLTIVGEAAKRVSAEFRASQLVAANRGFRDVVVHDYAHVDLQEVWRIVQQDLPTLITLWNRSYLRRKSEEV